MKALLSAILGALFLGSAMAATDLDFVLVNSTERSFEGIYLTSTDNKDWDGNLLSRGQALAAGGRITVKFQNTATSPSWDLRVVDDEGLTVTFHNVKLEGADSLTLKKVEGKITAEVE